MSEATIYVWRKKYGCMESGEVKRLKALQAENGRLRKMVIEKKINAEIISGALANS